ncbi:hypothetical protein [Nitrosomonas sp. Nm84]|nr:hypothetical protein [Nitrosomonas sp. Nm84]
MIRTTVNASTITVMLDLKGCSRMWARDRSTVIGAGVGSTAVGNAIGKT